MGQERTPWQAGPVAFAFEYTKGDPANYRPLV